MKTKLITIGNKNYTITFKNGQQYIYDFLKQIWTKTTDKQYNEIRYSSNSNYKCSF